ncbi:MAG: hypothetical protein HQL73_11885 [Magnetococcales bacterium]|nr:hypothetical protein [Magnetococcales bacterium]
MNETRLYLASQGYLDNFDPVERVWVLVILGLVGAFLLIGHLLIQRSRRLKLEQHRLRRKKSGASRK